MSPAFSAEERALLRGEHVPAPDSMGGWYPVVARHSGVWWRHFGEKRFTEPFFHDSLRNLPQDARFTAWTPWEAMEGLEDTIAPTAFIFHVSRCGSTLLTQLLATQNECIALSEPPIIDSLLGLPHEEAEARLRMIVAALGQRRFPGERHLFIKLDSWHIGRLPLFRKAFPETPFLFVYRRPPEVLASHRRQRGRQMVPGLVETAFMASEGIPNAADMDGYCVTVLEKFFATAEMFARELILVDYSQLPRFAWEELPAILALSLTPAAIAAMQDRSMLHSKNREWFAGDPAESGSTDEAICASVQPHYEMLERLRLSRERGSSAGGPADSRGHQAKTA